MFIPTLAIGGALSRCFFQLLSICAALVVYFNHEGFSGLENSTAPTTKNRKIMREDEETKFYYVFINSLSGFLKLQTPKKNRKKKI